MAIHLLKSKLKIIILVCGACAGIHLVNSLLGSPLNVFGIYPRNPASLPFIFTAPWIHGGWFHLISNLPGLAILSALCLVRGVPFYLKSSFLIIVITGLLVWLVARPAYHIGASGWIFGLWSLSLALAYFERSLLNIAIAIFVAIFYGGMIFGVLPSSPHISWEGHAAGAIAGIVTAYIMTRKKSGPTTE